MASSSEFTIDTKNQIQNKTTGNINILTYFKKFLIIDYSTTDSFVQSSKENKKLNNLGSSEILGKKENNNDIYNNINIKDQLDEKLPNVNKEYGHIFYYENKDIFSSFNNVFGDMSKNMIPHNFLDHLMINNSNVSVTKRYKSKAITTIYYSRNKNQS